MINLVAIECYLQVPCCLSQFPLRISYRYLVSEDVTLHVVLASSTLGVSTVASLDQHLNSCFNLCTLDLYL